MMAAVVPPILHVCQPYRQTRLIIFLPAGKEMCPGLLLGYGLLRGVRRIFV